MMDDVAAGVIEGKIVTDSWCISPASASFFRFGSWPVCTAGQTTRGDAASMTTSSTFTDHGRCKLNASDLTQQNRVIACAWCRPTARDWPPTTNHHLRRARTRMRDLIDTAPERTAPGLEIAFLVRADLELRKPGVGEQAVDIGVRDGCNALQELEAAGFGDDRVLKRRPLERKRAHTDQAGGTVVPDREIPPPRQIHLQRPERRAEVLDHRQGAGAGAGYERRGIIQAHQTLVLALVVPVRQEHRRQPERIEIGAWRLRSIQLPPMPALSRRR